MANGKILTSAGIAAALIIWGMLLLPFGGTIAAAQSTGDTLKLPSRTPTPWPTFTPLASSTPPIQMVWVGRLVSNTLGVTEGQGSIIRVSIQGLLDTAIELRSGNTVITANSGSKPEYGPFAAEFAPVTKGVWTVSVPALGVSLPVEADNYNLAVIEFVQVPAAEATPLPTALPVVPAAPTWEGRVTGESSNAGSPYARLLITVAGLDNQPVQISTYTQILNTAHTGQKPDELGPNTVEFAGLTPGTYFIDVLGLNASLSVQLKPNTETRVEFIQILPTATLTPTSTVTNLPPPMLIPPTATPLPTDTPTPTSTPLPTPTPTPVTRWIGVVDQRSPIASAPGEISVRVAGMAGMPVRLSRVEDSLELEQRCITGQGSADQDICLFQNLPAGWYNVDPEGLQLSLPVKVNDNEMVRVLFKIEVLPVGITGWQVEETQNTNGIVAHPKTDSVIQINVVGRPGQIVSLHSVRLGTTRYCEAVPGSTPGASTCQFGELGPGVYQVEALHTGASHRLFVDGVGLAVLEFTPSATTATQIVAQTEPVVGRGALPRLPTPTPAFTSPAQPAPATETPTPLPTLTPTPAFAWQGRVIQRDVIGAGAIGVRAVGLKDHPVIIRSGSWQSPPQLTGTKPELGEFATEFGGLSPGEYQIELVDLATVTVNLAGGEFLLVEFKYDFVTPEP